MATSQAEGQAALAAQSDAGALSFLAIAVPNATAFASSMCIMTVELVAGRIIARHVGNSLYTWTSVIGVVLAGIAAGNAIGGRVADRFRPRAALSVLFFLASVVCFAVPALNRFAGDWSFLLKQEWATRIAVHVFLVFFPAAAVLGCIGPLAAKMALDLGCETGRTVGNVYAWGALGSIVGTFLTGFILIAKMGTRGVLVSVALFMLLMSALFAARAIFPVLWSAVTLAVTWAMIGPWPWGNQLAVKAGLVREKFSNQILVDESQYSYIQIETDDDPPTMRTMSLDHLIHSYVVMNNPDDLQYDYEKLYASITRDAAEGKSKLSTLFIGGGGFVFPRYILSKWPASYVEVAEIDPHVTEAAFRAFGLRRDTPMHIFNLDARNHVDDLLRRKHQGEQAPSFDVIYGDAFNHYSVPYHLTTLEFDLKLRELLSPDGVYMINVLDIYNSGQFLGAILNTFEKCFPHVYAFSTVDNGPGAEDDRRDTFVVVGSMKPLQGHPFPAGVSGSALSPKHFEALRQRSHHVVLTDDYAPVEQLLEPVIRKADKES